MEEKELEGLRRLSEAVGPDRWVFGGDDCPPGNACLGRATRKGRSEELRWTLTEQEAELAADTLCAIPSLISDLRSARARVSKMEAAIRWAMGEQPLADGRWFDPSAFGHLDNAAPVYWWRTILRLYSGLADGNAAQPPHDSVSESVELREARRLLGEAREGIHLMHEGRPDWCNPTCLAHRIDAFLGERSDRERSEPPAVPDPVKVQ